MTVRHRLMFSRALCAATAWLGACASPPVVPTSTYGDALHWRSCPDDLGGPAVECTLASLPSHWQPVADDRVEVLVRRVVAGGRRQLWVLDGGPGFAGDAFLDPAFASRVHEARLDLMVVSHRGTVGPSMLVCTGGHGQDSPGGPQILPDEWPACRAELEARHGEGLTAFTSRHAALDVAYLMERAGPAEQRLVFGGSYGSLWAHRLLLDTDAPVDGVLLDSIVPIGASLERVDHQADAAAAALLRSCGEQPSCAERFTGPPVEAAREVVRAYARGEGCGQSEGLDAEAVQRFARRQLDGKIEHWRALVAVYAHLHRCDASDVAAARELMQPRPPTEAPSTAQRGPRYSIALNRHLLYRELYRFDLTDAEQTAFEAQALATSPGTRSVMAEAEAFAADYRQVEPPGRSLSSVPVTLLSGRLDPLDAPSWAADVAATLPQAELVSIPWAGHSTLRYLGLEPDGCGSEVLRSFFETGAAEVSCVERLEAPVLVAE